MLRFKPITEEILKLLSREDKSYTQADISKKLNTSRPRVHYQIHSVLLKHKLIEESIKSNISIFILTNKGRDVLKNFTMGDDLSPQEQGVRCHDMIFTTKILKTPNDSKAFIKAGGFRAVHKKNWTGYYRYLKDMTVERSPSSFIFYLKEFYATDSLRGCKIGFNKVMEAVDSLCYEFRGLKLGSPKLSASVVSQHYALPDDPAVKSVPDNFTYYTGRACVDASKGVKEHEFYHPVWSMEDSKRWVDFSHKIVSGVYDFESLSRLPEVLNSLQQFTQSGLSLLNMMYAHQKRIEADVKMVNRLKRAYRSKGQYRLNEKEWQ